MGPTNAKFKAENGADFLFVGNKFGFWAKKDKKK
jgi:hypothetical protein